MKLEPAHVIFLKAALQHRPHVYLRPSVSQIARALRFCSPFPLDPTSYLNLIFVNPR